MQLTVRETARLFEVTEKTIYRWIRHRNMPAAVVEEQYRFNRAELLEWASSEKIKIPADLFKEESEDAPMPGLADTLEAGGIQNNLAVADKNEALNAIVRLLPLPQDTDREFLLQILLAREALSTTAIGEGIAIPHVRNPIVLKVEAPIITLCYLDRAIDFGALDGQPVHVLFTMICPTIRIHLHLLSRLAHALRDTEFKELLLRKAEAGEILAALRRIEAQFKPQVAAVMQKSGT